MITLYDMGVNAVTYSFHFTTNYSRVCDARGLSLAAGLEQGSTLPETVHRAMRGSAHKLACRCA
jgi:hypothetical protein